MLQLHLHVFQPSQRTVVCCPSFLGYRYLAGQVLQRHEAFTLYPLQCHYSCIPGSASRVHAK